MQSRIIDMRLVTALVGAVLGLLGQSALADQGPVPPCAGTAQSAPPPLGAPPAIRVWEPGELPEGWQPPACLGWPREAEPVLVEASGRLRQTGGVEDLLRRVATVSALPRIQFWSVTRGQWLPLFKMAEAVTDREGKMGRPDFSSDELRKGATVYMLSDQNDPLGDIVQSLTIRERSADLLTIELTNVSSGTLAMIEVLPVGGARTLVDIRREAGDVWRFYTLISVADKAPSLLSPPRASWINRAAALYRWFAGIPTDQEPPPAR